MKPIIKAGTDGLGDAYVDYAVPISRRHWGLAMSVIAIIAIAVPVIHHREKLKQWVIFQRQLRVWESRPWAADRVLYEEDPLRAEALRHNSSEYGTFERILFNTFDGKPLAGWKPPAVFQFKEGQAIQKTVRFLRNTAMGCVMMRTDRAGNDRMVMMEYGSTAFGPPKGHSVLMGLKTMDAGLRVTRINCHQTAWLTISLKDGEALRLFAVQPVAKNPDRLTLRYEINSLPGTIELQVGVDGLVAVSVRDGPATQYHLVNANGERSYYVDGKKVTKRR